MKSGAEEGAQSVLTLYIRDKYNKTWKTLGPVERWFRVIWVLTGKKSDERAASNRGKVTIKWGETAISAVFRKTLGTSLMMVTVFVFVLR